MVGVFESELYGEIERESTRTNRPMVICIRERAIEDTDPRMMVNISFLPVENRYIAGALAAVAMMYAGNIEQAVSVLEDMRDLHDGGVGYGISSAMEEATRKICERFGNDNI